MGCLVAGVAVMALSAPAAASTGVSDERVVLPDGPGSIGGIGENVAINPGMGLMSYGVDVVVPDGLQGLTPNVSLSYSSGADAGVVGIGWDLPLPSIERTTNRGLPTYSTDDIFAANGSNQLVYVGDDEAGNRVYRARFEADFFRYTWHDVGNGSAGWWTAEHPDGTVDYYGAEATAQAQPASCLAGPGGQVFRYHLVDRVDPWGNRLHYSYVKSGQYVLLDEITYAFDSDDAPRYSVRFVYEAREDAISDAAPGYELILDKRLAGIQISSGAEVIRRYALSYEPYADSGGMSRLEGVREYGRNDVPHAIHFRFGYSRALGGACDGTDCKKPFVVDMGTVSGELALADGRATLIDINGDALPDLLNTSSAGQHTFYISQLSADGRPTFSGQAVSSQAQTTGFVLNAPGVQVLDVNGDGYTDIVNSRVPAVLCNDGSGDWAGSDCLDNGTLPQMDEDGDDPGDANPLHVRFFDYNNDKRIDMLRTTSASSAEVFVNTGSKFEQTNIAAIEAVFDEDNLQLADMNGDGLQDPVQILSSGQVRYRLNLGYGQWGAWRGISLDGFDANELAMAELQDINGDGLDDVVVVAGAALKYALNSGTDTFDAIVTVDSSRVEGDLPTKDTGTTVVFADMNGNGTDDPVWITSNGHVRFLELFPVRPNLLERIENGIGMVQLVRYGTSVAERARDFEAGRSWQYDLPHSMNLVVETDTWVTLSGGPDGQGLHERETFAYHDGYYDAEEKSFRGFANVDRAMLADPELDSQEAGLTRLSFDVGAEDRYRHGLLLRREVLARDGEDLTPLFEESMTYQDCPVAGIPDSGLRYPVRHVCEVAKETLHQEGAPTADWVTTRVETEYDGYGQPTLVSELGVVLRGSPDAAAPCGQACEGDELYARTEYVQPGEATDGAWLLGLPTRELVYGKEGGDAKETLTYYDGPAFEGLALGRATRGGVTRVMERVSGVEGDFVATTRAKIDANGNVVDSIDPLGSPENEAGHRRQYTYAPGGLQLVRVDILTADAEGNPYRLRRELSYEDAFGYVSEATQWMLVENDTVVSARNSSRYRYDAFGRLIKMIRPGDTDEKPTRRFVYELGDPASRILLKGRTELGGPEDIEQIQCQDGRGRVYQTRTRLGEGKYEVTGFSEFNKRGQPVRVYQPYTAATADCDARPADGVLFSAYRYDAISREVEVTHPDETLYGDASVRRTKFAPLATLTYDEEDSDPASPHYDTPTIQRRDGLERLVGIERDLGAGTVARIGLEYDPLGRLSSWIDADDNRHVQSFDLLDRVVQVDDPNHGLTTYEYDAASNQIARTDATGTTTRMRYDGVNRLSARWKDGAEDTTRVEYQYDKLADCDLCTHAAGQRVGAAYPLGVDGQFGRGFDRLGYDARGRLVYRARSLEAHLFEFAYSYDNADRLVRTTYPDSQMLQRSYDAANRLVSIAGVLDSVDYDARGLLSELSYQNGVNTTYGYDARQRLAQMQTSLGERILQGADFQRDRVGNISSITDRADASAGRLNRSATFVYDAWYRVLEASLAAETDRAETLTYTYDLLDNVLSRASSRGAESPVDAPEFTYGATGPNAATRVGDVDYSYDEAGKMTARGDTTLQWDYLERLVAASKDGVTGQFAYGPDGARVMKLEHGGVHYYLSEDFEVRDGISLVYARFDGKRVARLASDAMATELLPDLAPAEGDETLSPVGDDRISAADAWLAYASANGIVALDSNPEASAERLLRAAARSMIYEVSAPIAYLHHDHLGSITAATDADGEILGERSFYLEGELRQQVGFVDYYGFSGQERDASSGLLHYRARYLDPFVGRWTQPDPLFEVATADNIQKLGESTAAYAYVANNPVNFADPTGLSAKKSGGSKVNKGTKKTKKKSKKKTRKRNRGGGTSGGQSSATNGGGGTGQNNTGSNTTTNTTGGQTTANTPNNTNAQSTDKIKGNKLNTVGAIAAGVGSGISLIGSAISVVTTLIDDSTEEGKAAKKTWSAWGTGVGVAASVAGSVGAVTQAWGTGRKNIKIDKQKKAAKAATGRNPSP